MGSNKMRNDEAEQLKILAIWAIILLFVGAFIWLIYTICKKAFSAGFHVLYHYTDTSGYNGIRRTGVIQASGLSGVDAAFGYGVYLTSLSPSMGKHHIVRNNWDGLDPTISKRVASGRVDYAYKIHIPKDDRYIRKVQSYPRDIYVYSDYLNINRYSYSVLA